MTSKKILEEELKKTLPPVIQKLKSGDSSAQDEFAVLVLPYIKILLITFGKQIEYPDSTAGWVVMKLLRNIKNIDATKSVVGFITTTTNNYCIDICRENKRKAKGNLVYIDTDILADNEKISEQPTNTGDFIIDHNFTTLDADIIKMYYLENKTTKDISSSTGETERYINEVISTFKSYL